MPYFCQHCPGIAAPIGPAGSSLDSNKSGSRPTYKSLPRNAYEMSTFPFLSSRGSKGDYQSLAQSTDKLDSLPPSALPCSCTSAAGRSSLRSVITAIAKLLLLLLFTWGLISIGIARYGSYRASHPPSCSCGGTTVAEAQARGCEFSALGIAWLPPHCIDATLSEAFDAAAPAAAGWPYWADANGTVPLARQELRMLPDRGEAGNVFYTTQRWHVVHCMFTWRKQFRSGRTGVTVERRSNGLDHVAHCERIILGRAGLDDIATVSGIALDADDKGTDVNGRPFEDPFEEGNGNGV